jgi:hypothetical protein
VCVRQAGGQTWVCEASVCVSATCMSTGGGARLGSDSLEFDRRHAPVRHRTSLGAGGSGPGGVGGPAVPVGVHPGGVPLVVGPPHALVDADEGVPAGLGARNEGLYRVYRACHERKHTRTCIWKRSARIRRDAGSTWQTRHKGVDECATLSAVGTGGGYLAPARAVA